MMRPVHDEHFVVRQTRRLAGLLVVLGVLAAIKWGWDALGVRDAIVASPGWVKGCAFAAVAVALLAWSRTDGLDEEELDDDGELLPAIPRWVPVGFAAVFAFVAVAAFAS
jgi:hypothetical protein